MNQLTEQSTAEDIDLEISRLRAIRSSQEKQKFVDVDLPALKKLIGTTWVYRNNNRGDSEWWDTFRRVVAVTGPGEYGHYRIVFAECEIAGSAGARLTTESDFVSQHTDSPLFLRRESNWRSCSPEEYEAAFANALAVLQGKNEESKRGEKP